MTAHSHLAVPLAPFGAWLVLPFLLLLLAIAVLPLAAERFWEHNRNKAIVAGVAALPVAAWMLWAAPGELPYHLWEYVEFIVLLGALYTISGGIVLRGDLAATPGVNTAFLAIGAVAANVLGTTGASMLLIRPLLRTNQERRRKVHTPIFFIFIVSNAGGCLTPLGDPPLYMGFLQGVPFGWTLSLWPAWLMVNGVLLAIYWLWDRRAYAREARADVLRDLAAAEPLRVDGWRNIPLVAGVLACIVGSGLLHGEGALAEVVPYARTAIMALLAAVSVAVTPRAYREANGFGWGAIVEVAVLFAGIFVVMVPALVLLEQQGGALGISRPWQFFWTAGGLSSFLDNTPTYLTFLSLAKGVEGVPDAAGLLASPGGEDLLRALSLGAVFMGANSYIGNGPNFMVKAIAEARGPARVAMPSFGGYLLWAAAVLLPLFGLVTLAFFA